MCDIQRENLKIGSIKLSDFSSDFYVVDPRSLVNLIVLMLAHKIHYPYLISYVSILYGIYYEIMYSATLFQFIHIIVYKISNWMHIHI